ncbi:MAG: hypothetical protein EOP45_15685 [Sphingobacteriaceae bacterium]|nr:MAG: hypothetical protein EOP45_15685 [Sphingobacteriaceae bacterium]
MAKQLNCDKLLIVYRGNGKITYRMDAIKKIQERLDVKVIVINYRGSFEELSRDQMNRFRIREDNRVAMKFIRQHYKFDQYFIYGLSIGTAICSDLILDDLIHHQDKRFSGVILDNVFTSLANSFVVNIQNANINALKYVPTLALSTISKAIVGFCGEQYRNNSTWKQIRRISDQRKLIVPLLVFSSGKDKIMNPEDGHTIAKIMPNESTKYVLIENADHGSGSDYAVFYDEIEQFMS